MIASSATYRPVKRRAPTYSLFLVVGIFIGFMTSSFLSMLASCHDYQHFSGRSLNLFFSSSSRRLIRQLPVDDPDDKSNGWGLVHVFYGTTDHLVNVSDIPFDYFHRTAWFSQVRQDELVSKLLRGKRNGFFVDLAANDAVRISNTYALEAHFDWRGLCIEPNAMYWPSLTYRQCQVVGAVVGGHGREEIQFEFRRSKSARGGIVGDQFDNKVTGGGGLDQPRVTVSLKEIFQRFDTPKVIDYLSLDIEGAEGLVLQAFPFDQYRINLLTVERPNRNLTQLLESNGYVLLKQLKRWGETMWAHSAIEGELDKSALDIDTWNYKYREK